MGDASLRTHTAHHTLLHPTTPHDTTSYYDTTPPHITAHHTHSASLTAHHTHGTRTAWDAGGEQTASASAWRPLSGPAAGQRVDGLAQQDAAGLPSAGLASAALASAAPCSPQQPSQVIRRPG